MSVDLPTQCVLDEARCIVDGRKNDEYGPVEEQFARIAAVWSAVLGCSVTSQQVAMCMIGFKLIREAGKPKRDNLVDLAGYTYCLEKIQKKER